ncbi:MAG: ATP-binding protein [Actinobacteria bacterium]|nr:ATP-binding protein [Actinomycetota bacterium]NBR66909.1 ATP-binding protein [Actinomycetota bacterium]
MKYLKRDNTWSLTPDTRLDVRDALPPGNYTVCRNALSGDYFLEECAPFTLPAKLYGKTVPWSERILNSFHNDDHQTGVLLSGTKGSGKTLLSKYIATTSGLPVLIVNDAFSDDRFLRTIQGVEQPAVILFDEFEKLYDREAQGRVLTLFDGVYTARNKVMILTCNERTQVRDLFHNRPGRIRYAIDFHGLGAEFIKEYCADNLVNADYLDDIIKVAVSCGDFNFDMLQSFVRELNMYGGTVEDTVEILNVKPIATSRTKWDMVLSVPSLPNLKVSSNYVISDHPITLFQRRGGDGATIDFHAIAEGEVSHGKQADEGESIYMEFGLTNLKHVDPYTNTYIFEVDADIPIENDESEETVSSIVRIRVSEVVRDRLFKGGWGVGHDY